MDNIINESNQNAFLFVLCPLGITGATGTKGVTGNKGSTGNQGQSGQAGATGQTGYVGQPGLPGPSGNPGSSGARGPRDAQHGRIVPHGHDLRRPALVALAGLLRAHHQRVDDALEPVARIAGIGIDGPRHVASCCRRAAPGS